jgi:hypothetical protein
MRVDDTTIASGEIVALTAPALGSARRVIKDSMRAGQTADIPPVVGVLRTRFEDNLTTRRLLLVVTLLENDETPKAAMQAGFQAFVSELRAAVIENIFELSEAEGEALDALIKKINERVASSVKSAIKGGLSSWEKAKVLAGILDLDDAVGSAFTSFGSGALVPTTFTLTIESTLPLPFNFTSTQKYEIQGQLQLRPVTVDPCQAQVNAVNAAQAVVNDIDKQIQKLKDSLGEASPADKEIIKLEIAELEDEILPPAQLALENALRALSSCRSRVSPVGPLDGVLTRG